MLRQALRRNVINVRWAGTAANPQTQYRRPPSRPSKVLQPDVPEKKPIFPKPLKPETPKKKHIHISKTAQDKAILWNRGLAWTACILLGGVIAFYSAGLAVAASQPVHDPAIADLARQKDVSARYNETADDFDSVVGLTEKLMGVNRLRKRLAQQCTGHVLEASCGTGRNLGYYDLSTKSKIESLTFNDLSPPMVEICKKKMSALIGFKGAELKPELPIAYTTSSAASALPLARNGKKYDTIIQTMGLCSTPQPTELVKNLARYLNTSNPEARILLLEHGRSYKPWLNNVLDNAAEKHAEIHGCWFNRDIGALVEDAAQQSGLEVVRERRHHFGTTWVFELKPVASHAPSRELHASTSDAEQRKAYGWRGLLGW